MLEITNLKGQATQVETDRYLILISYNTPVAAVDKETGESWRTETKWSVTTSKHIAQWGRGIENTRPQEWFDNLL